MAIRAVEWQQARHLFMAALDQPAADRFAWLDAQTTMPEAVLNQVRLQLRLLDSKPNELTATSLEVPTAEADPTHIAHFRVLHRLGEGGMGIVYACEQSEPVRRRVAVKLLKPGMDSITIARRFDAERQALARMSHACIAQVFDGGIDEHGRHWFAMELVDGESITSFADRQRLSLEARIRLFLQICSGVDHAHRRGVLHRDLKPGNTLVQEVDGVARAKVIDFGIAKAVGESLGEATLHTHVGAVMGTPEYMSPEQSGSQPADLDIRTDVYSLGVVLYELLTGDLPGGSADEALRPSTHYATTRSGGDARAASRSSTPRALRRMLRQDLEWIVLRALQHDRERRYESVLAFARDLERYLAHEPVVAGPPSRLYRLRRSLRRHRVAAAIAASLVVGSGLALWYAVLAQQAQQAAERSRFEVYDTLSRSLAREALRGGSSPDPAQLRLLQGRLLAADLPQFEADRDSMAEWRTNQQNPVTLDRYLIARIDRLSPESKLVATDILCEEARRRLGSRDFADVLRIVSTAIGVREEQLNGADPRLVLARVLFLDGHLGLGRKADESGNTQKMLEHAGEVAAKVALWRPTPGADTDRVMDARFACRHAAAELLLAKACEPADRDPQRIKLLCEDLEKTQELLARHAPSSRGVRVANASLVELYELQGRHDLAKPALARLREVIEIAMSTFEFRLAAMGPDRATLLPVLKRVQNVTRGETPSTSIARLEAAEALERELERLGINGEDPRGRVLALPIAQFANDYRNVTSSLDEAQLRLTSLAYRLASAHPTPCGAALCRSAWELAQVHDELGQFREAEELIRVCVSMPVESVTSQYHWIAQGDWGKYLGHLEHYEEGFHKCGRAWYGQVALVGPNDNDAASALAKAADVWGSWSRTDPVAARQALVAMEARVPVHLQTDFDTAFLPQAAERFARDEVLARASRVLSSPKLQRRQLHAVALAYSRIGELARAREMLAAALLETSASGRDLVTPWMQAKTHVTLGQIEYAHGGWQQARLHYEEAVKLDSWHPTPPQQLTRLDLLAGDFDTAWQHANGDPRLQAQILVHQGQVEEALDLLANANVAGSAPIPFPELLPALVSIGQAEQARTRCEHYLADNTRGVDSWCLVARFLATCDGLTEADRRRGLELARRAQRHVGADRSARVEFVLGEADLANGNRAEGILRLQSALAALEVRPAESVAREQVVKRLRELQ